MTVEMMRLVTGETISRVEWECRAAWEYAAIENWWADPANAERQAEITRDYIAAMQRDRNLD